jgi:hypothetical protein
MTPFDFAKAAGHTKENIFDENTKNDYSSYMMNKIFSTYYDTILYANEANMFHNIPDEQNFNYYRGSLRSKNRYAKWVKPAKKDDLKLIQRLYDCDLKIAEQYLELLSEDDITALHELSSVGGVKK